MSTATMKIDGLAAIRKAMLDLPDRVATNSLSAAVVAGAALIRDEARALAPEWTGQVAAGHPPPGTLKRSIVIKKIPERSTYYRKVVYVTVRRGKKYQKQGKRGNLSQDAYYWRWVEFGHYYAPHGKRQKQGASGVFVPAHPFMRPAYTRKRIAAMDAIKEKLRQRIEQHAQELRR